MEHRDEARRIELRRFLKARRAAAAPPPALRGTTGRRRAGLRIEQVCALAEVSVSWYGALEQGKPIRVAPRTLERIADALQLDEVDRHHLFALAFPPAVRMDVPDRLPIRALLDGFTAGPAMLVDDLLTVIAYNAPAAALYRFTDDVRDPVNSIAHRVFTDPDRQRFYQHWTDHARRVAGILRWNYAQRVGDAAFDALIATLLAQSSDFCTFWEEVAVRDLAPLPKVIHVEPVGRVALIVVVLPLTGTGTALIFQTPETEHDAACLRALGVTAAT